MTKKDYEKIALVFQASKPEGNAFHYAQWAIDRSTMADMLERNNPRFDRERFERACEPGANVRART